MKMGWGTKAHSNFYIAANIVLIVIFQEANNCVPKEPQTDHPVTSKNKLKSERRKSKKDNNLQLGTFNIWRGLNLYFYFIFLSTFTISAYLFHLIHVRLPHVSILFLCCSIISKEENEVLVLLMVTTRHKEIIMQILAS